MKFLISFLMASFSFSQVKHPKVGELETKFTDEATQFLKGRFPNLPFIVTISISPMRREVGSNYVPQGESLPYYDIPEEKIRDEWDDPMASLYVLANRIQKATVEIFVPQTVSDQELLEIKDAIIKILKLVPARDQVSVKRKNWSVGPNFRNYGAFAGAILVILLLGLFLINSFTARKMAHAISDLQSKSGSPGSGGGAMSAAPAAPMVSTSEKVSSENRGGGAGDIKFRDPLRTRQFIATRIGELLNANKFFPGLEDMILLDKLAVKNPEALGALMVEFPVDIQKMVFSHSFHVSWLQAFSDPGELDTEAILTLEKLCRSTPKESNPKWQKLLIQVWRLGESRTSFMKTLRPKDAMTLLCSLPKSISLPIARKVFPGSWGALLNPNYSTEKLDDHVMQQIYQMALNIIPLRKFEALEVYRHEKDMLDHLRVCTIPEESDIYEASEKHSFIHKVRPPFYVLFNQPEENLKELIEMVSPTDWALALFNSPREMRLKVDNYFSKKQKFLFLDRLKSLDQSHPDPREIGLIRERIGSIIYNYLEQKKIAKMHEAQVPPPPPAVSAETPSQAATETTSQSETKPDDSKSDVSNQNESDPKKPNVA